MRERALRALGRLTRRGGEAAKPRCFSTAPPPPPPPTAPARSSTGGPVSWRSLALVSLTGAGLVTFYNVEKSRRMEGAAAVWPRTAALLRFSPLPQLRSPRFL